MTSSPLFMRPSDIPSLATSQDQLKPLMEDLQARHRKEAKDLQSRITQKKKGATKKTRKGVNDECETLERQLKERHAAEIAALDGTAKQPEYHESDATPEPDPTPHADTDSNQPPPDLSSLSLSIATTNSAPSQPTDPSPAPKKKQNRAKARLARRAAEQEALAASASAEATNLPDLKAAERERMLSEFQARNLSEKEVRADGHCLYSAFADQMLQLGIPLGSAPSDKPDVQATLEPYRLVRAKAADYIEAHPDDFAPFLEEPLAYYVHKVRNTGEWGGQLELLALARTYGVKISVLQGDGRVEDIESGAAAEEKNVWLAYYRHGFGLGEHYNSLRKVA